MTTDSYVQVAADSTGKKVATTEITRDDGTTVVEIQEVLPRAIVSDVPVSYVTDAVQPLSLTTQGRLRVSSVAADITQVWQNTFGDGGWMDDSPSAAQTKFPSAGAV